MYTSLKERNTSFGNTDMMQAEWNRVVSAIFDDYDPVDKLNDVNDEFFAEWQRRYENAIGLAKAVGLKMPLKPSHIVEIRNKQVISAHNIWKKYQIQVERQNAILELIEDYGLSENSLPTINSYFESLKTNDFPRMTVTERQYWQNLYDNHVAAVLAQKPARIESDNEWNAALQEIRNQAANAATTLERLLLEAEADFISSAAYYHPTTGIRIPDFETAEELGRLEEVKARYDEAKARYDRAVINAHKTAEEEEAKQILLEEEAAAAAIIAAEEAAAAAIIAAEADAAAAAAAQQALLDLQAAEYAAALAALQAEENAQAATGTSLYDELRAAADEAALNASQAAEAARAAEAAAAQIEIPLSVEPATDQKTTLSNAQKILLAIGGIATFYLLTGEY